MKKLTKLFIVFAFVFCSCSKDSIDDLPLDNIFDKNTNQEYFIMDSIKITKNPDVTFYFHPNPVAAKFSADIESYIVYRNGSLRANMYVTQKYFKDVNVASGEKINYSFCVQTKAGGISKPSKLYEVKMP